MKARGKEVYIITGVVILVVIVAWFFLLLSPVRKNVSDLDARITTVNQELATGQQDIVRLQAYRKTAPQTQADLLRLNKMLPAQSGIPSIIVELTQTASDSGLEFVSITPGAVSSGTPFGVEPITIKVIGRFYDLEDFLFRLESYVEYRNDAFLVTGRLLTVAQVQIAEDSTLSFPNLSIDVTLNAYLWQQAQPIVAPSAAPAPSASPSASPSSTATVSPSPSSPRVSPSPTTVSPSPSVVSPSPTGSKKP